MNKILRLFAIAMFCVFLCSCRFLFEKPSRAEAIAALQLRNPDTMWARIRTRDRLWVDRIYLPHLVNSGMVRLDKRATDSTGQLIFFTPEAAPFFLPTYELEKTGGLQRVFLAQTVFVSLVKVESADEPNRAFVDYVVEYRNLSPFAAYAKNLVEGKRDTFSQSIFRYYGVWQVDKSRYE